MPWMTWRARFHYYCAFLPSMPLISKKRGFNMGVDDVVGIFCLFLPRGKCAATKRWTMCCTSRWPRGRATARRGWTLRCQPCHPPARGTPWRRESRWGGAS